MVQVDITGVLDFLDGTLPGESESEKALTELKNIQNGTGWVSLPADFCAEQSDGIYASAERIARESEVFVIAGIGGSYLGARAALEYIKSPFYNALKKDRPDILFVGNNISADYLCQIIELIGDRDFSAAVVSKSGTTLETAIALRFIKDMLVSRYGSNGLRERLYVITDKKGSALLETAQHDGSTCFTLPEGVGGRYSVLTAVGLLPCAVAGIDIDKLMSGAREEMESGVTNACIYARVRQALYSRGKKIELLSCFEPSFRFMGEWWKQLFGESEGKDLIGIFPAQADYTADLHSLGQYVQEGERCLMETIVSFVQPRRELRIPGGAIHCDKIQKLEGRDVSEINKAASEAVKKAHIDGGVPVTCLSLNDMSERSFGALVYFFQRACAVSALMSGVDPFGQPGVEAYKKNLFAILG